MTVTWNAPFRRTATLRLSLATLEHLRDDLEGTIAATREDVAATAFDDAVCEQYVRDLACVNEAITECGA